MVIYIRALLIRGLKYIPMYITIYVNVTLTGTVPHLHYDNIESCASSNVSMQLQPDVKIRFSKLYGLLMLVLECVTAGDDLQWGDEIL